jgi:hypothetical protein
MRTVVYHPKVPAEVRAFLDHYDAIPSDLGDSFRLDLIGAITGARDHPERHHFDRTGRRWSNRKWFPLNFLFRILSGKSAILMVLIATALSSNAAPITWGTPVAVGTGVGNSADVSTNGTLVEAYNAAITSYTGGNKTVNGVTFVATTNLLPSNATTVIDFSTGTNGGDAAYDAILSTADYGGGDSTTIIICDGDGNTSVNGPGLLEVGKNYQIQVWFVDDRSSTDSRVMGFASSSSASKANVNDQHVIGTFTADAATQTLFLDTVAAAAGDSFGNAHLTAYQIRALAPPADPTVTLYGSNATSAKTNTVFLTVSDEVSGLEPSDFVVVNGSVTEVQSTGRTRSKAANSYQPSRRHYSALVTANAPGTVQVTLPAGAVNRLDSPDLRSLASNTFSFVCNGDFNGPWTVDEAVEWTQATSSNTNLQLADGFARPTADSSAFTSVVKAFPNKRKATRLMFKQSPVWDNWIPLGYDIGSLIGTDAPVLIPAGPGNYYILALKDSVYQAWHSTNMVNWTLKGPVVSGAQGRWVTSAEYKNGSFYIYSDHANDHTSHVFRDNDLGDGIAGTYIGPVLSRNGSGSDLGVFRDNADGLFHLIYEDWSPINASQNSWDSPLAGHTSSADGISGFFADEHQPPVDHRTTPTGTFGSYDHPHVSFNPTYEIHTPAQDAFGDWTAIKVGEQYYLFGDYDSPVQPIRLARFTGKSIYGQFALVGSTDTGGHPDASVGFAEGRFYLITQANSFQSPGPWVDGVEARAGVDVDGNGSADTWTSWQTVEELYHYTPNFIRVVTLTPAALDLSGLPPGFGFQFEFRLDDTIVANVSPIIDRVEMSFAPSNFEQWSNQNGVAVEAGGDHNGNQIPNLVEFALGQATPPARQPDGTLVLKATHEALADGYAVGLRFSRDLKSWALATPATEEVKLRRATTLENGDQEMLFDIPSGSERLFWQIVVF